MSEQTNSQIQNPEGSGGFLSPTQKGKTQLIKELLEKKKEEIMRVMIQNNIPETEVARIFALPLIDEKKLINVTWISDTDLLGYDVDEVSVSAVEQGKDREFGDLFGDLHNKITLILKTKFLDAIKFEIITGSIIITKDMENKLSPILLEFRTMKTEQELKRREEELKEREQELKRREEKLKEREQEYNKLLKAICDNDEYDEEDP